LRIFTSKRLRIRLLSTIRTQVQHDHCNTGLTGRT
jgi:hypothetical protein